MLVISAMGYFVPDEYTYTDACKHVVLMFLWISYLHIFVGIFHCRFYVYLKYTLLLVCLIDVMVSGRTVPNIIAAWPNAYRLLLHVHILQILEHLKAKKRSRPFMIHQHDISTHAKSAFVPDLKAQMTVGPPFQRVEIFGPLSDVKLLYRNVSCDLRSYISLQKKIWTVICKR